MRFILALIILILLLSSAIAENSFLDAVKLYKKKSIRNKSTKAVQGMEFSELSRGTLLKVMAAFEDYLYSQLGRKKERVKPVFQATFINNVHTYPFVYPKFYNLYGGGTLTASWASYSEDPLPCKLDNLVLDIVLPSPNHTQYPGFRTKTSRIQLLYSLWVNMPMIGVGLAFGFSSITVMQLSTDRWLKNRPTEHEIAIIASSLTLAAPIGSIICGIAMDRFGRRPMMIICLLPMTFGWTYIGLSRLPLDLVIGRVITGIGVGMAVSPPRVYTTEISLPNMRATFGGTASAAIALGMTIQACLGFLLHWRFLCISSAAYCLGVMFANCFLPESPYFILMKGSFEEAEKVLRTFRSRSYNTSTEMQQLNDFKLINSIRRLHGHETLEALFKSLAYKPFWIIITYILTVQLSGNAVMTSWTVDIFNSSGATIDPYLGNLMLNIVRLVACIAISIILFWVTIRPLALISCVGVGCACLGLSLGSLSKGEHVIPPEVVLIVYAAFSSVSFHSLPLMLLFEIIPLQIRGVLGGIVTGAFFIMAFGSCAAYPYLKKYIGFGYTFLIYGICSLLGCSILFYCLPETKGLTLQEIEEKYNDLRTRLTSRQQPTKVPID